MKNIRIPLFLAISLACGAVSAQTIDNWRSASGIDVKNSSGDCWRAANWTPATAAPGCDGATSAVVQKVAVDVPAPVAAPAPAPQAKSTAVAKAPVVTLNAIVNFEFAKSTLTPAAQKIIDATIQKISLHGDAIISMNLVGHTDEIGSFGYNDKLSVARANAVKDYFTKKGIAAKSIVSTGAGETFPLRFNGTAEGRSENRRVEIFIHMAHH